MIMMNRYYNTYNIDMIRPFGCTSFHQWSSRLSSILLIMVMVLCTMVHDTTALQVYVNDTAKPLLYHMRAEFGPWEEDPQGYDSLSFVCLMC